jgi:hypothetical protein
MNTVTITFTDIISDTGATRIVEIGYDPGASEDDSPARQLSRVALGYIQKLSDASDAQNAGVLQ